MTSRFLGIAGFAVALGFARVAADVPPTFPALFGRWLVNRMVGAAPITGSDQAAKAPLGTIVIISAGLIRTGDNSGSCKPRNPTIVEVETEAKLQDDFGTKGSGLYLPRRVLKRACRFWTRAARSRWCSTTTRYFGRWTMAIFTP